MSLDQRYISTHQEARFFELGDHLMGPRSYVAENLQQYEARQIELIASDLLRHLLPPEDRYRPDRFPLAKLDIVCLLLNTDAKVIDRDGSESP
jgi:hypothetical protein